MQFHRENKQKSHKSLFERLSKEHMKIHETRPSHDYLDQEKYSSLCRMNRLQLLFLHDREATRW